MRRYAVGYRFEKRGFIVGGEFVDKHSGMAKRIAFV
jgi:hypothetical protein